MGKRNLFYSFLTGASLVIAFFMSLSSFGQQLSFVSGANLNKIAESRYQPGLNTALMWKLNLNKFIRYKTGIGFQQLNSPGVFLDCPVGEPDFIVYSERIRKDMLYMPFMIGTEIRLSKKYPLIAEFYSGTALQWVTNSKVWFRSPKAGAPFLSEIINPSFKNSYVLPVGLQFQATTALKYVINNKIETGLEVGRIYTSDSFLQLSGGYSVLFSVGLNMNK